MAPIFAWDPAKAIINIAGHEVTFEEAVTVFADPLAAIFEDEAHSEHEEREIIVGHSSRPRLLVVSFMERRGVLRIISARLGTPGERRRHEEEHRY